MQPNDSENRPAERLPAAPTGNASNPSGSDEPEAPANQLLDERAEKYLRESASIEDLPDDQDWQDANGVLKDGDNGNGAQ